MSGDSKSNRAELSVPAGKVVFRQGDDGGSMFIIRKGKVRLTREADGIRRIVAILSPGDFFGEMAVVSGRPRSATADVIEDAELIRILAHTVEEIVSNRAEVAFRLIQRLADRLEHANRLIDLLMQDDPHVQTIIALRNELELAGSPDFSVQANSLAARLGLRTGQVDQALRRLVRVGVIETETDPERIVVKDPERLEAFLEFVQNLDPAEAPS